MSVGVVDGIEDGRHDGARNNFRDLADSMAGLVSHEVAMRSAMGRYFFDIRDSRGYHRDVAGDECDGFAEARAQCQALLPDIARGEMPDGELHDISCEVRNETGHIVYRGDLTFRETMF